MRWNGLAMVRVHGARGDVVELFAFLRERFQAPVWTGFPKSIRVLLDNPYVFAGIWKFQNGSLPEPAWKASFAAADKAAHVALGRQDTVTVLIRSRMTVSVPRDREVEAVKALRRDWRGISR